MDKQDKIYVAGHRGMVGSAIIRELERQGYTNIITRTHSQLDLRRQEDVEKFFEKERPDYGRKSRRYCCQSGGAGRFYV